MPKKSNKSWGDRGNIRGNEAYFGHDDRVRRNEGRDAGIHINSIKHHVSFKTFRPNNRDMSHNLSLMNLDEDISMFSSSNNNTRQVVINQRDRHRGDRAWETQSRRRYSLMSNRNFKGGQVGFRLQPLHISQSNWYKIIIPYGHKYEKDYVINTLLNYIAPEVFVPLTYKIIGNNASFYVDDYKTASALLNCDHKIMMSNGYKLQVKVQPGLPICEIDDKLKERLKQAMVKRYVQETNALDLSKFYLDPGKNKLKVLPTKTKQIQKVKFF